jgi:cyclophilin family peptidyl-prolyl cis-trans isomerase
MYFREYYLQGIGDVNMRSGLFLVFGVIIAVLIVFGVIYSQSTGLRTAGEPAPAASANGGLTQPSQPDTSPTPIMTPTPSNSPVSKADLTTDANGLSKATVILNTSQGIIKFKFYPEDAPKTVHRLVELIDSGFYNGLSFHRVVPGFVIQGGDPLGNGTGGSGQKLEAEFNKRKHIEGAVAMARAADPNSADSQFYISLGTHPHLDNNYTVFGQVIEGLDSVKKIKAGDKITSATIQ